MRQVIKLTLVLAMCVAFLVPEAWGRPKDYGDAIPWGDGVNPIEAASAPSQVLVFGWQQIGGITLPIISVVRVKTSLHQVQNTTRGFGHSVRVHSKKKKVR